MLTGAVDRATKEGTKRQRSKVVFIFLCAYVPAISVAYTTANRYIREG
jgi:hypothetical protein